MTTKTIEDVEKFLAEEIMDYEEDDLSRMWVDKNDILWRKSAFKPDQNFEQAFEVLEEYVKTNYEIWNIGNNAGPTKVNYHCELLSFADDRIFYEHNKKSKAIIGAILKAENKTELLEVLENQ